LPEATDGRRCDYAKALALALDKVGRDPAQIRTRVVVPDLAFWRKQETLREAALEEKARREDYARQKAINDGGGESFWEQMARESGWGDADNGPH
jgi:hypothetical protein